MKTAKVKQLIVETPEGHSGSLTKEARYVFNYHSERQHRAGNGVGRY
jgi:hypothetical protein